MKHFEIPKPSLNGNAKQGKEHVSPHPRESISVFAAVLLGIPGCTGLSHISGLHTVSR